MAVAVALSSIVAADPSGGRDSTRDSLIIRGTLTLSGNYGGASTHGDTVDFSGLVSSDYIPKRVSIYEDQGAGNAPLGFTFLYTHGTTQADGLLQILGTQGTGAATTGAPELTENEAYASTTPSLDGAVLQFEAWFAKNI